ncbi:DUF979 family protein [Niveispirillum sp.]|uniref:DUF979 domain-containing protein n=1 Tax=Niveispirillum sp. TaxID=1917217 RepID=UPI001B5789E2|nr:DUF979 family protein [Niveispirillum sp.]MBP7337280.1 DUF979 domain-containing protein [Niveispirillum sp.]
MINVDHAYLLLGAMFAGFSLLTLRDPSHPKRLLGVLFWGLLAVSMLFGSLLGGLGNGLLVLALVIIVAIGGPGASRIPALPATEGPAPGYKLAVLAVAVPFLTVAGTLAAQHTEMGRLLISNRQTTLIVLGLACLLTLVGSMLWLRPPALAPVREGRRLMEGIGWAALMPQMLAALGAVFLASNVGGVVGDLVSSAFALDTKFIAVTVYCLGMALFTIIMGNAFAAFPVMTAAIALPFIVHRFGGDPAIVCAIGMLAGFCGTLLTPMAANFNVVPANLLGLPDRDRPFNGVIRAQAPSALVILIANILLMYFLAF